ncbi:MULTISPECIES: DUF6153 family protein [unclassified Streptomyces]
MAIRTARSGGRAVRWTYGVFLTLCVALAVLVHHETAATGAAHMTSASSMSAMDASSVPSVVHARHTTSATPNEAASATWEPSSTHSADTGPCSAPGMQHCTAASVGSVPLAVPEEAGVPLLADRQRNPAGRVPASTVGRAPPDLSVLSQLRI